MLPVIGFTLNNDVHASISFDSFYVNILTHPRVPLTLPVRCSGIGGGSLLTGLSIFSTVLEAKGIQKPVFLTLNNTSTHVNMGKFCKPFYHYIFFS